MKIDGSEPTTYSSFAIQGFGVIWLAPQHMLHGLQSCVISGNLDLSHCQVIVNDQPILQQGLRVTVRELQVFLVELGVRIPITIVQKVESTSVQVNGGCELRAFVKEIGTFFLARTEKMNCFLRTD